MNVFESRFVNEPSDSACNQTGLASTLQLSEACLQFFTLDLTTHELDELYQHITHCIKWQADYFKAFDRLFPIPRLQAWYADDNLQCRYSDNLLTTQAWPAPLLKLRQAIEAATGHAFNSVLATLYRNGQDHVGWHADDEKELGPEPIIASISFGASRNFEFRRKASGNKDSDTYAITLHHNDCLLMLPNFQQHWQHQVPPKPSESEPRINLTFRKVINP